MIFIKYQGKPGIVREFSIIFIQSREKSGKSNYEVRISFSLSVGMVVCKAINLIVVCKC